MHQNNVITITLASTSAGKRREIEAFFTQSGLRTGMDVKVELPHHMPDIAETGGNYMENARIKASAVLPISTDFVLAEDSGFEAAALAGLYGLDPFPGLKSARWLTPEIWESLTGEKSSGNITDGQRNAALLKLMAGKADRRACYRAAIVLFSATENIVFEAEGRVELTVIEDEMPRGEGGFGYDPIVCPIASELSILGAEGETMGKSPAMAQLPAAAKNKISHRGRALNKLAAFLQSVELSEER